jgi:formylglycine-generating enzyme required for sulfatase activity
MKNTTANVFKMILRLLGSGKATIPLAALLLLSYAGTALAQGTVFTYQGQLSSSNAPANGSYDLTFALFNASSAGTQAGTTITNAGVAVADGLFTVMLDFGNQFNGAPCWLEIGVRSHGSGNFIMLSPRQQLLPMPYAIMANTASNLLGTLPAAQLTGTMGNSQLANNSITVTAGTGLNGGGTVALGGSTTLSNAGVLSVTGNADITASTLNGVVSLGDTANSANTPSTLVKRDAGGNFSAGTITASLAGNATSATTANGFSGSLVGDVTGPQGATVVGSVGGQSAANVASGAQAVNAATTANTPSTLVKRDASGNFSAGTITASLAGNATSATTANGFSGSLAGDVAGTQAATVIGSVGGQSAANVASGAQAVNAATSAATPNAIVQRDATGSFAATNITVSGILTGNGAGLTNLNATNLSGKLPAAQLSGTVANSQLANNSITVTSGTGLNGGGTVALGGSTTLNNAGVLSVTGNADITASTLNGVVTLGDMATSDNTPSTLVKRDGAGNFSAGTITASLAGNATSATTANGFSGSLVGDVTGPQGATVVGSVGGQSAANVASGAQAANAATSAATPNAIVQRDATGSFAATNITVSGVLYGNGAGLTNLTGVVLAPGSITADKLAPGAVTSNALAVGAIVDADISSSGISGNKIIGGDLQAQSLMVGASHTLIGQFATIAGGFQNAISNAAWSADAIGGGQGNQITSAGSAAIAGGYQNAISNSWASTVAGGSDNLVAGLVNGQGNCAIIGGGNQNKIVGAGAATIAGGSGNAISNAAWSPDAIGGGQGNQINGASFAAIAGGFQNTISNSWASTVAGGSGNLVVNGGGTSAIGGGTYNTISNAWCGTIPGGRSNQVTATYGFAAGYRAHANHGGSFVWGDSTEADVASTGYNQFLIRASGGVGIGTDNPATALEVNGTVTATAFVGDGSGLTNLNVATSSTPPGMVLIPAGAFTMGDTLDGESDAIPTETVTVSAFYMDVNLVSYSQWQSVYYWATSHGYGFVNAGSGKAANHPVQTVDWYDVVKWCNARSQQAGRTPVYYMDAGFTLVYRAKEGTPYANWAANGYRLPTEAEWEKAARGGLSGQRFPWGNVITENLANYYGNTTAYSYDLGPNGYNAAFATGGEPYTSPVGYFAANGYGLYDMAGNVYEWCWDWYGTPYAGGSDPRGPASGSWSSRVLRGGRWNPDAYDARCACRGNLEPGKADGDFGFRCVRGL